MLLRNTKLGVRPGHILSYRVQIHVVFRLVSRRVDMLGRDSKPSSFGGPWRVVFVTRRR